MCVSTSGLLFITFGDRGGCSGAQRVASEVLASIFYLPGGSWVGDVQTDQSMLYYEQALSCRTIPTAHSCVRSRSYYLLPTNSETVHIRCFDTENSTFSLNFHNRHVLSRHQSRTYTTTTTTQLGSQAIRLPADMLDRIRRRINRIKARIRHGLANRTAHASPGQEPAYQPGDRIG